MLVNNGQLVTRRAHVQAAHRCGQLQQGNGKRVVHKDLQDLQHRERTRAC